MTAKEAYEQAKTKWPTPEQELKNVLSDIKYCVERGLLELDRNGMLHKETKYVLSQNGYEVSYDLESNKTVISWRQY